MPSRNTYSEQRLFTAFSLAQEYLEPDLLFDADHGFIDVYPATFLGIVVLIQIGLPGYAISAHSGYPAHCAGKIIQRH